MVKVEPHTNGPLFVELHFYCRATKISDLEQFKNIRQIKHLGVPDLKGHGSFNFRDKRLRFIVLPRYGTDLQTMLDQSKSTLSVESTSSIAIQVITFKMQWIKITNYISKNVVCTFSSTCTIVHGFNLATFQGNYLQT